MLADGHINPRIAAVWKLDKVLTAVEALAGGGTLPGKQVIRVAASRERWRSDRILPPSHSRLSIGPSDELNAKGNQGDSENHGSNQSEEVDGSGHPQEHHRDDE
jgi:hypothetical protein